jgi:hypothetical protein
VRAFVLLVSCGLWWSPVGMRGEGVGAGSLGGVLMPSARNVTASTNMMLGSNPSF